MERAIIYARVSTDDQRDNYSIPSQVDECKRYIEKRGYILVGNCYVDPVTGYDATEGIPAFVDDYTSRELNRPALDSALEYLDVYGFDVAVVFSMDRLDRDPFRFMVHEREFRAGKARLEFVKESFDDNPSGNFMKHVLSAATKLENDWRTDRFTRGKRQKARSGVFVGSHYPYGYEKDPACLGGLGVIEDQAKAVKMIFDAYVNRGLSLYEVVDAMSVTDLQPSRGEKWARSSVTKILKNSAYIGKTYYNKNKRENGQLVKRDRDEWIEIAVTPIVSQDLFDSAQARLANNKDVKRRQPQSFYMLSGMVKCADCGRPFVCQTRKAGTNRQVNDAQYYRHRVRNGHCRNQTISARLLDAAVWDVVETILLNPGELKAAYESLIKQEEKDNLRAKKRLEGWTRAREKLTQKLQRLTEIYTDPDAGITKGEFLESRRKVQDEIKDLDELILQSATVKTKLPNKEELDSLQSFSEAIKRLLESQDYTITPDQKRSIMQMMGIQVQLNEDHSGAVTGTIGEVAKFDGQLSITSMCKGQKTAYFTIPITIPGINK